MGLRRTQRHTANVTCSYARGRGRSSQIFAVSRCGDEDSSFAYTCGSLPTDIVPFVKTIAFWSACLNCHFGLLSILEKASCGRLAPGNRLLVRLSLSPIGAYYDGAGRSGQADLIRRESLDQFENLQRLRTVQLLKPLCFLFPEPDWDRMRSSRRFAQEACLSVHAKECSTSPVLSRD